MKKNPPPRSRGGGFRRRGPCRISQAVVLEPDGIATVSRLRGMVGGVSLGQSLHPSGCVLLCAGKRYHVYLRRSRELASASKPHRITFPMPSTDEPLSP